MHNVVDSNIKQYLMVLESAREDKHSGILSQAEVQGHVTRVNLLMCLERVVEAVRRDNTVELGLVLKDQGLNVASMVKTDYTELYMTHLVDHVELLRQGEVLKREAVISSIESANILGGEREQLEKAMHCLNHALR